MITLVIVTNPFSPQDGRVVSQVEYDGTLGELLKENTVEGVDMQATVNGYSVDNDYQIKNDDFVVIYPVVAKGGGKGGKGILGIVAAIALSVVSFGIASGGWLAASGFFAAGQLGAYMAAAAVMFLGSSLIGRMAGQKIDTGGFDGENEPTYSWGGVQTMEGQNNAVSLTYGKVKSGGQTIGKFVSSKDNDEYLNWLIAAGEGPLTITDIKLNDNAIKNYSNVTCEIRTGTNDQKVIPYFNDTYFTKNLSYHMTTVDQWYADTAQGTATEGLIFKIEFPNGLFHGNDHGGFSTNTVKVEMQYKLTSSKTWIELGTFSISGDSNKAIRKEYRVDNIAAGAYDVRARVISVSHSSANRDQKECYFTGITSIVYDDFIYPCQALIGIRAKATDQLNGSPSLSFMKERQTVLVYNPHTTEYEQHLANNPAWACYDLLHQARKLKNVNTGKMEIEVRGAAKELMRYDDFAEWAAWCDEKEYFVNIEINTVGELLEIANQKIAPIGHGLVVRFGTRYGCIYNHVQTPVQMFGMGNIKEGSFNEEFLKVSDRANCVEITFTNKDAGYEREVITIYGDTYDSDGYAKTAQMTFDGITDYKQAYREGMYQLYSNKYLLRTVTFTAGIDSIACTVGDVVMVSHDVPRWANSGRIESIDGATWVLPIELEDLTKSYRIQWRTQNDNLYTRACEVVSSADGWTTITVSGTLPKEDMPQAGDVFDIAVANIGSKPFVVKSITRSQDFERTISCLEYNENIYDENYDIPVIDYAQWYGEPGNVTGLVAALSQSKNEFGDNIGKLQCSWNMPDKGERFTVLLSTEGENWTIGKSNITGNTCKLDVLPNTTYWVKVVTLLGVNQSSGTVAGPIYPTGNGALPVVTNLVGNTIYRSVKNGEVRYEIHLIWDAPLLANYRNCDVWYKTDNARTSDISMTQGVAISELGYQNKWQYAGQGYSDFTLSDVTTGDRYRFAVVTKDMLGNKNLIETSPMVTVTASARTETPNTPDGFGITYGNGIKVSWKEVANTDIAFYEVRDDVYCGNEDGHLLARTNGTLTTLTLTTRTGTLFLFAKSALGKYSAPAVLRYSKTAPGKPDTPTVKNTMTGFSVAGQGIPADAIGMIVYINDGDAVKTENPVMSYNCEPGIYDVAIAYYDIFGAGERSATTRTVVKIIIDETNIKDMAISLQKVDKTIQDAVKEAQGISGKVAEIKKTTDSIQATVADDKKELASQITQNSDKITSIVTNLGDSAKAKEAYSAIAQMQDDIALRVKSGEIISQINLSKEGVQIDGKLLHVTGDTLFDKNVVVKNMIQAGAVTADKMAVDSLSAITANVGSLKGGTITGTQIVGANLKNSSGTFTVDDHGNVKGINITAGTITADVIKQSGFKITAVTGLKGTMQAPNTNDAAQNWLTIPLPAGYEENECIWGAFPKAASDKSMAFAVNGRQVRCYKWREGESVTTYISAPIWYWIIGIKGINT